MNVDLIQDEIFGTDFMPAHDKVGNEELENRLPFLICRDSVKFQFKGL